jgi:magnesium transporter
MAKPSQPPTTKARLFDADRSDKEIDLSAKTVASVGDRQLLWVDALLTGDPAETHELLALLPFEDAAIERMWASTSGPRLSVHGDYFLVRVVVLRPRKDRDENVVLDLAVGKNVVLTAHREPVAFLAEIDTRIRGDTTLGEIDSTDFSTVLMDGLVTSYLELTDAILAEVDKLDGEALQPTARRDLLTDLVALRHRIAAVRRVLVAHRTVIASMAGAEFRGVTDSDAAPRFAALTERFDGAIGAIDTAREALLGTFDIHMSRTAQRTNEVMKTLTIVSVLLLPAGVIAGFMGMNIKAPYSNDDPTIFWFVVLGIALVAGVTLIALRVRKWL